MRGFVTKIGNLVTKIESWYAFASILASTGLFAWIGQQWKWLADQGWPAVLFVSFAIGSLAVAALSAAYLAIGGLRMKPPAPQANSSLAEMVSAIQAPRDQQIANLESHNRELQHERDALKQWLSDIEAGGEALVSDVHVRRADDVTSRYWVSFRIAKSQRRMFVLLDLQVSHWKGDKQRSVSWSKRTRHLLKVIEPAIKGQTQSIQIVGEHPQLFEERYPCWLVDTSAIDEGRLAPPPTYTKAAIVFVADEIEQEYKMLVLPRLPGEALSIIDERHFGSTSFWGDNAPHLNLRLTRGLREMTTPEARA